MPYGRYWHSVSFDLPTQNATIIRTMYTYETVCIYITIYNDVSTHRPFGSNSVLRVNIAHMIVPLGVVYERKIQKEALKFRFGI